MCVCVCACMCGWVGGGGVCYVSQCCSVWMVVVPCSVVWCVCIHNGLIVARQFKAICPWH